MKRIILLIATICVLAGCTFEYKWVDAGKPQWAYDSYWNLVFKTQAAASKEIQVIDSGDMQSQVDAWRLKHPTIQIFVEDEETPIDLAPLAVVWIVNAVTHDPIKVFLDVPRASLVESASLWALEAQADGGEMYVDVVPPAPLPQDETYKYYLYLIAENGDILFSTQCTPELFPFTLTAYNTESYFHPGSHVVHGELYHG